MPCFGWLAVWLSKLYGGQHARLAGWLSAWLDGWLPGWLAR